MVLYSFKTIAVVPSAKDFVDIVLSKTQRKTPTVIHNGYAISRIRKFYMRKVKYTAESFHERLSLILSEFPRLDDLHPFYADLINVLYSRDHYKLALAQLNTAKSLIDNIGKDYLKLLKFADSLYRAKELKRAALGRMCTLMKKLTPSLAYLEQVRQHLSRLPSIDPNTRTLLITGWPNTGKSSFLNLVTNADVEVQPYAFTTKSIFVGHCIAEGTLVNLADGRSVPIEEVQVGDGVLSLCVEVGEAEGLVVREVDAVLDRGFRACVELLFCDGRTLICTPDHLIRTADSRWVAAGDLVVGQDMVAVGTEYPNGSIAGEEEGGWRLSTRTSLGYDLDMSERAPHSLAFARLLGYALTDAHVTARQSKMYLGHQLDVDSVLRDTLLLAGIRPVVQSGDGTLDICLPGVVTQAFLQVGVSTGKRLGLVTHFPSFITDPRCPLPVVREFLGGLFGGDGMTLYLCHRVGSSAVLTGLGFCTVRSGDVAAEQQQVLRAELLPLLERCGINCSSDVTFEFKAAPPCTLTREGHAEVKKRKAKGEVIQPSATATTLQHNKAYKLVVKLGNGLVSLFARGVGFRHCAHKQLRLTAAMAHFRYIERFLQQRLQLSSRIAQLAQFRVVTIKAAAAKAKEQLAQQQSILPELAAWTPKSYAKLQLTHTTSGGTPVRQRLQSMASLPFFSEAHTQQPYNAARRLTELAAEGSATSPASDEDDDTASVTSPAKRQRAASEPVVAPPPAVIDLSDEHDDDDDDVYKSVDKVRYATPKDARALPLFCAQLTARRDVGQRRVYDLSVPSAGGDDSRSFVANGVVVHNCDYQYVRWQVVDTPGLLDHALEERNVIEMQAITALAHLHATVLYFIDPSEQCGYSVQQQVALFHSLQPLFSNKPLLVVANKSDLKRIEDLDPDDRRLIESMTPPTSTTRLMSMSNSTTDGVNSVMQAACDLLLQHRVERKIKSKRAAEVLNRISVAQPIKRDDKPRPTSIPASVLRQREAAAAAAAMSDTPTPTPSLFSKDFRASLHRPPTIDPTTGKPRVTERDLEAAAGGPGVYNVDLKKRWLLAVDEWRWDVIPEIMDGKNVADFVDVDIERQLQLLEEEEEEEMRKFKERGEAEMDDDQSELDEEDKERVASIREKKALVVSERILRHSNNKPILPRSVHARHTTLQAVGETIDSMGLNSAKMRERSRSRSRVAEQKEGGGGGEKRGRKRAREDDGEATSMDVEPSAKQRALSTIRARSQSRDRSTSHRVSVASPFRDVKQKAQAAKLKVVQGQRKMNLQAKAGESDRRIYDLKPKHLFSGKRGAGKTDRR